MEQKSEIPTMNIYSNLSNRLLKVFNKKKLKLHEPLFSKNEKKSLIKCIESGFVSSSKNGFFIKKFENQIKKFTKAKYVISTNSGVSGLHASLIGLNVDKNDEVFLPSLTFVATAHSILYSGATPHFVEVNEKNLGICPVKLEKYLKKISIKKGSHFFNKKTKKRLFAIIPVHVFGLACNIKELKNLATKYKMKVVEDATEALGSFYSGKHVGNFGDTGVFSFNGNKIITSGGGGLIVTQSAKIFKKVSHIVANSKIKHRWEYIHDEIGFNYRMPNINAALASGQFENFKKILKSKKKVHEIYKKIFKDIPEVYLFSQSKNSISNYWLNTIRIEKKGINKEKLIKHFFRKKIFSRPVWKPLHTLKHLKHFPKSNLKITNKLYSSLINLPSGPGIIKK